MIRKVIGFGTGTLISRVFGYIRDVLLAMKLGTGSINDAFVVALRLPNLFRAIFAEGALNNAFVPIYSSIENKNEAAVFAARVRNILFLSLLAITLVAELFMPYIVAALAPGIIDDGPVYDYSVLFSRLTFPYLLFIAIAALFSGQMSAYGKFFPYAVAPLIFNLATIVAMLISDGSFEIGLNLSIAVALAGVLQLLWTYICLRIYGILQILGDFRIDHKIKLMFRRMVPVIFTSSLMQINILVDTIFASMQVGALSYLYYANRVNQLPLALIGIAAGIVILPKLSKAFKKDIKGAMTLQTRALEYCILLVMPAAAALVFAADEIIKLLLERGAFDHGSTIATALALKAYGFGLPAWVMLKVLIANFHARGDTKFTFYISAIALGANVVLNALLFWWLGHYGIALASSISAYLNLFLLSRKALKIKRLMIDRSLWVYMTKAVVASIVMIIFLKLFIMILGHKSLIIMSGIFFSVIIYFFFMWMMGISIIKELRQTDD